MRFYLLILVLFLTFTNCSKKDALAIDVSNIDVDFDIKRFEIEFYTSQTKDLPKLKKKYPLFFPINTADSVWINKLENKDEQELFLETQKEFKDFSEIEKQVANLLKHITYYYPDFKSPTVITVNSNIDYQNRIIYADTLVLVSLDAYLGENHPFYGDYPKYIKQNNTKENIVIDVANVIIDAKVYPNNERTFLSKMINEGKKKYLLNAFLPSKKSKEIFGWENEKFNWAENNEEEVWKYFIENNILYSTDGQLEKRFLEKAPFSKFYLQFDNLSPGQIGNWVGYKMVKSYMQNNDVSLQELLKIPSTEVYKNSKYKPKNNGS